MKSRIQTIIWLLLFLCAQLAFAQSEEPEIVKRMDLIGFQLGYGSHHLLNIEYDYRVTFLQGQYFYPFYQRPKWNMEVLGQPQVNWMRYRFSTTEPELRDGYEVGLNVGFLVRRKFNEGGNSWYLCISAGPHYVTGAPRRQVPGFIFSDNLLTGLQFRIRPGLYFDARLGGRHISNANLNTPNGGVNTLFFSFGLNWSL